MIRDLQAIDVTPLRALIRSDATFKPEEWAVAEELIDASAAGSSDYFVLVDADETGELMGYICFGPTPMTARTWDLYWIVVDAKFRGQGSGRRLVVALEARVSAAGGGNIRVETSETEGYGSARGLYEKLGFPEFVRFPNFYAPNDALIVYYKEMGPSACYSESNDTGPVV